MGNEFDLQIFEKECIFKRILTPIKFRYLLRTFIVYSTTADTKTTDTSDPFGKAWKFVQNPLEELTKTPQTHKYKETLGKASTHLDDAKKEANDRMDMLTNEQTSERSEGN